MGILNIRLSIDKESQTADNCLNCRVSGNSIGQQPKLFMQTLDWGQITPESFNSDTSDCTHIYNHDLTSVEKVERSIRFILGRLTYYDLHLPTNSTHSIIIDIRGQQVNDLPCEDIIKELKGRYL